VFKHLVRSLVIPVLVVAALSSPMPASAQHHGPVRVGIAVGGYYGPIGFYSPWYSAYYSPWYSPFYAGWYPYGPYQPWGPYGFYGGGYYDDSSSLRLEVTPHTAEVFVDGYRAGTVDDFDGFFQRLRMRPGQHEVALYLDGYRTVRQHLEVSRGADQKIRYTMVPLTPGESAEPRPTPPPDPPAHDPQDDPSTSYGRRGGPPQNPARIPPGSDSRYGSVSIRVQPADAEVLIDGERWSAPSSQERLVVQLSDGRHHVEVRKEGFETYSSDVQVRRGETATLNVSLLRARYFPSF